MVKKYVKKPIEIEAVQWTGSNFDEMDNFITTYHEIYKAKGKLFIHTMQAVVEAEQGDYVIKGLYGECYPCNPIIFKETYDLVGGDKDAIND